MTMSEPATFRSVDGSTALAAASRHLLVADIGGSHIRLARQACDDAFELLIDVPTPANDWGQFCAAISEATSPFATGSSALSISIAGVVDPYSGEVAAANIPCINGRSLARDLAAVLGMPVVVTNDADCAALAEARIGAGVGHGVVFCAILGTGVGGGLIVNGRLVRGAGGLTGEWGHGPVVNEAMVDAGDGRSLRVPRFKCGCGMTGCLDTVGGARGLERLHEFLHGSMQSSLQILDAWIAGEASAAATVRAWIELVSGPLALVVNVTGASVVPVCGGLSRCTPLVTALDLAVRQQILRRSEAALLIPSPLNDQAGLIGAAFAFADLS